MRKKELEKEVKRQGVGFADLIGEILDHLNLEIESGIPFRHSKNFRLVPKDKKEEKNGSA